MSSQVNTGDCLVSTAFQFHVGTHGINQIYVHLNKGIDWHCHKHSWANKEERAIHPGLQHQIDGSDLIALEVEHHLHFFWLVDLDHIDIEPTLPFISHPLLNSYLSIFPMPSSRSGATGSGADCLQRNPYSAGSSHSPKHL